MVLNYLLFIYYLVFLLGFIFRWWKAHNIRADRDVCPYRHIARAYKNDININKFRSINSNSIPNLSFNSLGEVLSTSIQKAIHSVVIIGGFVVLFSVIVSMLNSSKTFNILNILFSPLLEAFHIPTIYLQGIITGIIEVTNGVKLSAINTEPISIIVCSFLLGFGGFSVLLQVLSITSKAKISIKPYIIGKFIQACISGIFMYFWVC